MFEFGSAELRIQENPRNNPKSFKTYYLGNLRGGNRYIEGNFASKEIKRKILITMVFDG